MIRGNYSLAKDVRRNEQKQKQKIQLRQKNQHKLDVLSKADPIKIYFHIQNLEKLTSLDQHQQRRLKKLKEDWQFIRNNKLFAEKVDAFLEKQAKVKATKEKEERKLWGSQSVYFNPELNPYGKVPYSLVSMKDGKKYPNLKKPVKNPHRCVPDPLIIQLHIEPPVGDPPKFYKLVQNTSRAVPGQREPLEEPLAKQQDSIDSIQNSVLDSDSDN